MSRGSTTISTRFFCNTCDAKIAIDLDGDSIVNPEAKLVNCGWMVIAVDPDVPMSAIEILTNQHYCPSCKTIYLKISELARRLPNNIHVLSIPGQKDVISTGYDGSDINEDEGPQREE